jgi:hypothetical protein
MGDVQPFRVRKRDCLACQHLAIDSFPLVRSHARQDVSAHNPPCFPAKQSQPTRTRARRTDAIFPRSAETEVSPLAVSSRIDPLLPRGLTGLQNSPLPALSLVFKVSLLTIAEHGCKPVGRTTTDTPLSRTGRIALRWTRPSSRPTSSTREGPNST